MCKLLKLNPCGDYIFKKRKNQDSPDTATLLNNKLEEMGLKNFHPRLFHKLSTFIYKMENISSSLELLKNKIKRKKEFDNAGYDDLRFENKIKQTIQLNNHYGESVKGDSLKKTNVCCKLI